ncbi:hypothetical protein B566_EDAN012233, partial [Ephemera danica]
MLKLSLIVSLGVVLFLDQGDATSLGAPVSACEDMTPRHGLKNPQPNPSPFTASVIAAGTNMYNFRLTADAARPFKGLFVQARDAGGNIVGTFSENTQLHTIDCTGGTALDRRIIMLKLVFAVCLGVVLLLDQGDAHSSGAPVSACEDMTPRHPNSPQANPSPFSASVTAAGTNMYNSVILIYSNAATHNDNMNKTDVSMVWDGTGVALPVTMYLQLDRIIMLKLVFAVCLGVVLLLDQGDANSSGAPTLACEDMTPQHPNSPQANPSPFSASVTAAGTNMYNSRAYNAATHNDNMNKTDVSVVWDGTGVALPVTMYYTTCQNYDFF